MTALMAGSCPAAASAPTSFPIDEFLHGVRAGRTYLGGTPPVVVGAKSLREFKRGGRYAYVIQLGVRRAARDGGDGTFVVVRSDTYGGAIAHILGLSPGTIRTLQLLFPKALPRQAAFPALRARITYRLAVADPGFLLERGRFALQPHPTLPGVVRATSLFGIRPGTFPLVVRSSVALAPHRLRTIYELLDWVSFALDPFEIVKTPAGYVKSYLGSAAAAAFTDTETRYLLEVPALMPDLIDRGPQSARAALAARTLKIALRTVPTNDRKLLGPGGASRVFAQGAKPGQPVHPHATVAVSAYVRATATAPAAPFSITKITSTPTMRANTRAGDVLVVVSGAPTYPLLAQLTWPGCPAGLQCSPLNLPGVRPASLEVSHVVLPGVAACRGEIKAPVTVTGSILLRDAKGAQTAPRTFTFTCRP